MRTLSIIFAILLFSLGYWAFPPPLQKINQIVDQTNFLVNKRCSGTLIDLRRQLVITNYHCVQDKVFQTIGSVIKFTYDDVRIGHGFFDGYDKLSETEYSAKIIGINIDADLALLQIYKPRIDSRIASTILPEAMRVTKGEDVWIVGNPGGWYSTLIKGNVSNEQITADGKKVMLFSGGIIGGSSGGAVYNMDGYLIGIPVRVVNSTFTGVPVPVTFMGMAIPVETIRDFLKENEKNINN